MPVGNQSSGGSSGGASAGAIRAGKAVVEIGGDDGPLRRVLNRAGATVAGFGSALKKIGGVSLGIGAGFLAPISALLGSGIERADKIGDLAEVFGLTAESASRMASAFELAGGSIDEMEMSLSKLAALSKDGEPLDETLLRVADALGEIDDASERFQAAKEIFGAKFAGKFIDTGSDVRGVLGRGQTISAEEIANAKKFKTALAEAGIALQSALLPVLQYLAPVAKLLASFARSNASLLVIVFGAAAGLVAFGTAAFVAGVAIKGIVAAVVVLKAIFLTVGAFLISPMGLVVLAVGGAAAAFFTLTETGKKLASGLGAGFREMGEIFGEAWGGIANAVTAGNLELAFEIVGVAVSAAWWAMLKNLRAGWNDFVKAIFDTIRNNPWLTAAATTALGGAAGFLAGGPAGAFLGAAGGFAGGALLLEGADDLEKMLKIGGGVDGKAAAARVRLKEAAGKAAGGVNELADKAKRHPELAAVADQIKGGFQTFGVSAARFGFGDTIQQNQLKALIDVKDGNGKLPDRIAAAVANAFQLR